jgi:uncharacterized NAD(P)/FAD-binding protein YdhS
MTQGALRVAIVGAGFTGTMLAVQLLRHVERPIEISLIDRRGAFGRGLAYSARNPRHVLNVRVANMSAFDEEPQHFITWLWANDTVYGEAPGVPPSGHAFVSRATYGAYIEDVLRAATREAAARATVVQIVAEVLGEAAGRSGCRLALSDGRSITVDRAVLCVGNFPPATPSQVSAELAESNRYIADPWDEEAIDHIGETDRVLVIGTRLTMVDMVIDLVARGHRGTIRAVSRHGLLPHAHEQTRAYPAFLDRANLPQDLSTLARRIRSEMRRAREQGHDWRSVMDTMRPLVQALWLALPEPDRKRFLRHLRPYWDIHRHRMAPQIAHEIDALRAAGRLTITAGRILEADLVDDEVRLAFRPRENGHVQNMVADWIVNCSGPETDYTRIRHPLIQSLLASGQARPDRLALGLDLTDRYQIIGKNGTPTPNLFALGPPTRGLLWESTAVPDIRKQCAHFAAWIADDIVNRRSKPSLS